MLKLFIALFGLILVYWIYKKKKQLFVRHPQVEPVITTLEAYELQAFLDATTPLVCLEADGKSLVNNLKKSHLLNCLTSMAVDVRLFKYTILPRMFFKERTKRISQNLLLWEI